MNIIAKYLSLEKRFIPDNLQRKLD